MQSSSRNGATVIWLALHTTEGIMRAVDLRAWTTWAGSSHASCDETGVLLSGADDGFVDYSRSAWTMRNANPISDQNEMCGFAKWKRDDWLARPLLLDAAARWLAERHLAQPWIPLRRLTDDEIRNRVPGVLGHGDYSRATGDGTHWDPGPDFPWDVVLAQANAYRNPTPIEEDEMADPNVVRLIQENHNMLSALIGLGLNEQVARLSVTVVAQGEVLKQLAARQGTAIDMAAVEAVVEKGVKDAIEAITVTVKPAG